MRKESEQSFSSQKEELDFIIEKKEKIKLLRINLDLI
jgi:hypothetical protein